MNGYSYSKIEGHDVVNESSISKESSDLMVPPPAVPETTKPTSNPTPSEVIIKNSNPNTQCSSELEDEDSSQVEVNNNEEMMFDPKLRRNSSVSSAYALQLQAAVKRAFSTRRSCSVSESYSRIHDPYVTLTSPLDEDESNITDAGTKRSKKKNNNKNRRDKILKAWKKIFGL